MLKLEDMAEQSALVAEAMGVMERIESTSMRRQFARIFGEAGWNIYQMRHVLASWNHLTPGVVRSGCAVNGA